MKCPQCLKDDTRVRVTLPFLDQGTPRVLRNRECPKCKYVFKTLEAEDSEKQKCQKTSR